ncbi:hypothetical protein KY325_05120 [Candidatus Woesearchaeota archaeon]|nr:hypothetical protein [Candidatus Woesearchaeota archaeon]MBW3018515.1 hypothetical protein [Candidatus Woesearchaeota archaeon]
MKQKTLFKIALICALVGIFLIYLISTTSDIEQTSIFGAKYIDEGVVKVKGTIDEIEKLGGITILRISSRETIPAVVFEGMDLDQIQTGDAVEIIGEIDSYNGKKQLVVKEIRK